MTFTIELGWWTAVPVGLTCGCVLAYLGGLDIRSTWKLWLSVMAIALMSRFLP